MDIKKASIDELKAELARRERRARVIEIPGPNGNNCYGVNDPDPVSVWDEACKHHNLDPARVARAASLCLCMEDFLLNRCEGVLFSGDAEYLYIWLCHTLEGFPVDALERCQDAARAAGWID